MSGQPQRANVGAVDNKPSGARRFAIYAGDGIYLRSLSKAAEGRHSFGRDRARSYARETAIAALHVVRREGRAAWIVPHPGCAS